MAIRLLARCLVAGAAVFLFGPVSCSHASLALAPPAPVCPPPSGVVIPTFQRDAARTGWDDDEPELTVDSVTSVAWGQLWESDPFDSFSDGSVVYPPHAYASPLYADGVLISGGPYGGNRLSVLYVATNNAFAYAINAVGTACANGSVPYGAVLWRTRLGTPVHQDGIIPGAFDGVVPVGALSTPILRLDDAPPRLYVVTQDGDRVYRVFALDAGSGQPLAGWPVTIDKATVAAVAPAAPLFGTDGQNQRAGLNLSPDGGTLYVGFSGLGWLMTVDTRAPRLAAAFPGGPAAAPEQAGIWGPGGPAVDANGTVYATTGNGTIGAGNAPSYWGESLLAWDATGARLTGSYTPFNYCDLEVADADVGGNSPLLFDLDPATTSTPHLIAFGSKQGNVYLLERDRLPGRTDARQPCSTDASTDTSLLAPGSQPQFGTPGPLNVFGPYSEVYGNLDYAKMRSGPALYRSPSGITYLYVSGASKASVSSQSSVAPSLVRLRVGAAAGAPAYLTIDAADADVAFLNPGSPVVTSAQGQHPIVWVVDENAKRVASLADPGAPRPILYAFDGETMQQVWRSPAGALSVGGKYNVPAIAHGIVYVATDRVQAFGLGATAISVQGGGP
jgi:hypothetical protein